MNEIKELRAQYSLTQKALADLVGMSKRTIEAWEAESVAASRQPPDWVVNLIRFYLEHQGPPK